MPDNGADFHIYFWYYLLPFLRERSRVGFPTSDTWLNMEYGQGFKKYLNRYFRIMYVVDSSVERWFEDAMVNTVITILERTEDEDTRENNRIKFVRINRRISDIVKDIEDALKIAGSLERGISVEGITVMREVRQGNIDLDDVMKSRFFPYLRPPDEFFEIVNNRNMVPLEKVMDVQRGFTTGANNFFYVEDITYDYSDEELKDLFGLRRGEKERIRVIKDGLGAVHLMEKEYLMPILKSPKGFTQI
ncbi:hypothetical protein [Caldiplasma sukawensis]